MNCESVSNGRMIVALKSIALMLCGLSLLPFSGCSVSKPAPVTIAFTQGQMAPPSSVAANSSTQFAATVNNDPANLGVSWLLSCNASAASDSVPSPGTRRAAGPLLTSLRLPYRPGEQ